MSKGGLGQMDEISRAIGKIESSIEAQNKILDRLEKGQEELLNNIRDMQLNCEKHENKIQKNLEAISELKDSKLTKTEKVKLDGGAIVGVINFIWLIIKQMTGQ